MFLYVPHNIIVTFYFNITWGNESNLYMLKDAILRLQVMNKVNAISTRINHA